MKATKKKAIITAMILTAAGAAVSLSAFAMAGFDPENLNTVDIVTQSLEIRDEFQSIKINCPGYDVCFVPSENGDCGVVFTGSDKLTLNAAVRDGTLNVGFTDNRSWYDYIGVFMFGDTGLTVSIPQGEYEELIVETSSGGIDVSGEFTIDRADIRSSSGSVSVRDITARNIDIMSQSGKVSCADVKAEDMLQANTSSGNIELNGIECRSAAAAAKSGRVSLSDIKAEDSVGVESSSGGICVSGLDAKSMDIQSRGGGVECTAALAKASISVRTTSGGVIFDGCDAGEIFVETSSGNVSGTLLTEKIFFTETNSGNVDVPFFTEGGVCRVKTSSGSIKLSVE